MNIQEEKQAVEQFINAYAEVLNKGDKEQIPTFYEIDGLFMPNQMKTISGIELQKNKSDNFFKKVNFHIDYTVNDIVVDGRFAFVQALAKTTTTDIATNEQSIKTSRDFFVLHRASEEWKIYRYMFNNVLNA
jgi:ketosteroid isomerase-like protein